MPPRRKPQAAQVEPSGSEPEAPEPESGLSKEESGVNAINDCLSQIPVACGGTFAVKDYKHMGSEWLVALINEQKKETIVSSLPITQTSAKSLYDSASPSSFGNGDSNVYDESVRLAREYPSPKFALAFDPLHPSTNILRSIEAFTAKPTGSIYAVRSKLAIYKRDGFFSGHRDTPRSEDHIGTIVVCLPCVFGGGEFILTTDQNGEEDKQILDWAPTASEKGKGGKISWVFFYSDTCHEINRVKSGYRMTVQYDVYQTSSNEGGAGVPVLSKNQVIDDNAFKKLKKTIRNALFDKRFFPKGGKLTWAFEHSYPHCAPPPSKEHRFSSVANDQDVAFRKELPSRLKGTDFILYRALQDLGFGVSLLAVYDGSDYADYNDYAMGDRDDDEGREWENWKNRSLITSPCFILDLGDMCDEDGRLEAIIEDASGAKADRANAIWCRKPKVFTQSAAYIQYGNEASISHLYVSGVLQIYLPPADKRKTPPQ